MNNFARLMRFDRPSGTILLLWPTLWAVFLASHGFPAWHFLVIFTIGVVAMRHAGCLVNDMADSQFDKQVTRTQERPLATGEFTRKQAAIPLVILSIVALILVLNLNFYSQIIAVIAFAMAVLYPFTKRFFPLPQLFLGITWSLGMLMAFAAIQNAVPLEAYFLYCAHVCLTTAYDTIYALGDKEDDLKLGLHSAPILFGEHERFFIFLFQLAALIFFIGAGIVANLSWPYWTSVIIAAGLLGYQQHLIQDKQPAKYWQAFRNNQWLGVVILLGIALSNGI